MMVGEVGQADFEETKDKIEHKLLVAESAKNESKMEVAAVETIKNFCNHFLNNLGHYWRQANYDQKVRIQTLIFPQGVMYEKGMFTIPEISCLYSIKENVLNQKLLVRAEGFRIRIRASIRTLYPFYHPKLQTFQVDTLNLFSF